MSRPERLTLLSRDDLDRTARERRVTAIVRAVYRDLGHEPSDQEVSRVVRAVIAAGDEDNEQ